MMVIEPVDNTDMYRINTIYYQYFTLLKYLLFPKGEIGRIDARKASAW
jgi:hypothetical protein